MKWTKSLLSDQTNIDAISIACGNGYYVAVCIQVSSSNYNLNIMYSQNPTDGWTTRTLKNTGVDNILTAGIVFTGEKFVIPYTTYISHAFSAIVFSDPAGNISDREAIFSNTYPITLNSVRYVGSKVIVCGTKLESDTRPNNSGWIWYCTDPADSWTEYCIVEYSADESTTGNAFAATYNSTDTEYDVYAVARVNNNTNYHRIYASSDLVTWSAPIEITNDTFSSSPFPTLTYCEDYDAFCLFLHGNIYISKANQNFVRISYPTGIGAESIRTATSDGTKFLAPSASNNQTDLKVLYSSGDPVVADNWRVDILNAGVQLSTGVQFVDNSDIFVVLAGAGGSVQPAIFTARFNANEFRRMKDRVPTYPGRVKLIDAGEENTYYLTRDDDPTEVGTKLSKVNLLSDDAALAVWNNTPPNILCTPSTALEHLGNNAFHVGDILTTVRDLSTDENWLKCTGGGISEVDYPELYPLLQTGSVEGDWDTNVVDNSAAGLNSNDIGVATDGEWYVMAIVESNYPGEYKYDYNVYYTKDPSSTWTKKAIATGVNWMNDGAGLSLIYANGYFSFLVTEYTATSGYLNTFVVYANDPSGTWNTMQIGGSGWFYNQFKYVNNTYIATTTYSSSNYYNTVALTFDAIGGTVTTNTLVSNQTNGTYAYDIDYYNDKWYAIWYQNYYNSSGSYISDTRLYYSDTLATVYSAGQYTNVEYTTGSSGSYSHFQPQNLTCGNGYYVVWGYRSVSSGQNGLFDMYYSNDLTTFTRSTNSNYYGMNREANVPIFYDGAFYVALRGVSDSQPYILYGADPTNFTAKLLFNGNVYRVRLTAADASKTLFVGAQSQNYTTYTAAWQKVGKSLPKLSPGTGLNAYIKAKEGD